MKGERLQIVLQNESYTMMVTCESEICQINDNDYYLLNDEIIRKGHQNNKEPMYIKVLQKNNSLGTFKRIESHSEKDAAIWQRID